MSDDERRIVEWLKEWASKVPPQGAVLWHVACRIERGEHKKPTP